MNFKEEFITRHMDLINPAAYTKKIVVIGAGAIGSFTVLALAKMGYQNIEVWDFDTIENENISSQFYPTTSIGMLKTLALQDMVKLFTGTTISIHSKKLEPTDNLTADIIISAVDSMEVRKMIYDVSACYWLIDPRMGAEYASMEVVEMSKYDAVENYKKTLYSDASAVQERCTAKTTIYTVFLIAGQIVKAVKDITNMKFADTDGCLATATQAIAQEPITNLDWNIAKNSMMAFSNGRKL